ncbi:MAG: riboflavin synthase [Bacteroidota bacterium]|nr:riboflavin synthase [Bacteroidota bacterium]
MFTGIIEAQGVIQEITRSGSNKTFRISSVLAPELRVDQSLSHDGACLTVEAVSGDTYTVTAIEETLSKTTLNQWKTGDRVNLERCMQINGRLDGHIVQGHVDCTAVCVSRENKDGSWEFRFEFPESFSHLMIEKGSIAVNGISLTCFGVAENAFRVAIIPYTFEHTNANAIQSGSDVNIEFDMIGKYVNRFLTSRSAIS